MVTEMSAGIPDTEDAAARALLERIAPLFHGGVLKFKLVVGHTTPRTNAPITWRNLTPEKGEQVNTLAQKICQILMVATDDDGVFRG